MNQTVPVLAETLRVPDGQLHYELRGQGPLMVLVGAPMDARAFGPVAELLAADHTVLTTDPRGIFRSALDEPHADSTPELRADDLARLISHVDAGPAVVLGSSGGAVSVLALAQGHPDQVSTAIAHEPPLASILEDREHAYAQNEDVIVTYLSGDVMGAWRKFMVMANIQMPEPVFMAMFGGERDAQAAADEHYQHAHMMRATIRWQPDIEALKAGRPRIVVGIGEQSTAQFCDRTSTALAQALGIKPTMFPGGHTGFAEAPEAFAARLREIL